MTRNEQIMVASFQRMAIALEAAAVSANAIANSLEEIRVELKKKRFDDADAERET